MCHRTRLVGGLAVKAATRWRYPELSALWRKYGYVLSAIVDTPTDLIEATPGRTGVSAGHSVGGDDRPSDRQGRWSCQQAEPGEKHWPLPSILAYCPEHPFRRERILQETNTARVCHCIGHRGKRPASGDLTDPFQPEGP